jgi:hypothetical protein
MLLWPFMDMENKKALDRALQMEDLGWHLARYGFMVSCIALVVVAYVGFGRLLAALPLMRVGCGEV